MKHNRALITLCTLVLVSGLAAPPVCADIYTWVDEHGITHYSTSRPAGRQAQTYPTDPAFKVSPQQPVSRTLSAGYDSEEALALRERVDRLENLLETERRERVTDLRSQLDNERERVRRLEAEQVQWADLGGPWSAPGLVPGGFVVAPASGLFLPTHRKFSHKPGVKIGAGSARLPYPSLSGPSADFATPSRRAR